MRHTFTSAVHLFLQQENKILLLRRNNTGYEDGNYSVVAGHIDANEPAKSAMIREAKEESGIDINIDHLELVHIMHRKGIDNEKIDFFFEAREWLGTPKNLEPDKCDELKWFDLDNLPENIVPYIDKALNCIQENIMYSEFGWKGVAISA